MTRCSQEARTARSASGVPERRRREGRRLLGEPQEGLLDRVLDPRATAQEGVRVAEERRLVPVDEGLEGRRVA